MNTANNLANIEMLSDVDLMEVLCAGCNDALAILFKRHSALVFHTAKVILRDDGEAEETVQRVFLDIFRAARQFDSRRGTFTTWLLQYAYHRSFDRRTHLQANHFYDLNELDDQIGNFSFLPPQEVNCLVEQALAILEPHQRKVIELTYFEGLTALEIAERTGDSASSVRHNLYRGLKKMRIALSEPRRITVNFTSESKMSLEPFGELV